MGPRGSLPHSWATLAAPHLGAALPAVRPSLALAALAALALLPPSAQARKRAAPPPPSSAPSPYRFADSPLTARADAETSRALRLHAESPTPGLLPARPSDVAAFRATLHVVTEASEATERPVLRLTVLLTRDGLYLDEAAATSLSGLRARPPSDIADIARGFARGLASGTLASRADSGLATCQSLRGGYCGNPAGVWEPTSLPPALRAAFAGPVRFATVASTEVLLRHDDGRLLALHADWASPRPNRPSAPSAALTAAPDGRWSEPPPTAYPSAHLGPDWSRWCAHDWTRLASPQRDVSGRCLLQLLSDAYDSPVVGGRIADMMMLDFEPMPPPDESHLSINKLEAAKQHLAHRCTEPDLSPCGRVLQSLDMGLERKRSLMENVALGSFTGLLATVLAGEALPDDLGATGRSRWSELTLDKLAAAVWARNGYVVVQPELAAFLYDARPDGDEGASLLPLPWPDSGYTGLSKTDRANLSRIQRNRR